jgi:tetratricopeptide (TPR) repeat protein
MAYKRWAAAAFMAGALAAAPAIAAPDYLADCTAADSTVYLRIESCTFALESGGLSDAQRVQALLNRAKGYIAKSLVRPARADIAEAKRLAPDDPTVAAAQADLSHFMGQQAEAIAGYKQVIGAGANDATTQMKLGMSYVIANKYAEAQQAFSQILKADPDNVSALLWRSTTYAHDAKYDLALADLNHAAAKDPQNLVVRQWRGEEFLYAGQFDAAITDLNVVFAAKPKIPLFRLRGIAYYAKGNYAAAAADFEHDLNIDPAYANLAVWRFFAEKRAGQPSMEEMAIIIKALNGRWPTPLLEYVLGRQTADQAMAAATSPDPTLQQVYQSQTQSIIGEWLSIGGDVAGAKPHFAASRANGVVVAAEVVKPGGSMFPPDTIIDFAWATKQARDQKP